MFDSLIIQPPRGDSIPGGAAKQFRSSDLVGGEQLQGGFSQAESGILQDLATAMTYSLDVSGMM